MDIGIPIRTLGAVNCQALTDAVRALDASVWDRCTTRQEVFGVHKQTKSIVMLFSNGWPTIEMARYEGWDILAPVANPVIKHVIKAGYPPRGRIIRSMVVNLMAGGSIAEHYDSDTLFTFSHRIHVPLQTNPDVCFTVGGSPYNLEAGMAYEINNQLYHSVVNGGDQDRWHLIFDYLPLTLEE